MAFINLKSFKFNQINIKKELFNMKKSIMRLSLTALLVTASATAMADDSFDISVIGNITPAACKATIAGGHVFDYGDILAGSLSKDDFTVLPQKSTGFSIVCDAPAKVALQTTDNRSGTNNNPVGKTLANDFVVKASSTLMGLGLDPSGNKIGAYMAGISAESVTTDMDSDVTTIWSKDKGVTWVTSPIDYVLFVNNTNLFTWAKSGETTPVAFTTLNGQIDVQAAISPASTLNLSQPVKLDGSATVQLYYL
jgi:type 1 fimbria pilin